MTDSHDSRNRILAILLAGVSVLAGYLLGVSSPGNHATAPGPSGRSDPAAEKNADDPDAVAARRAPHDVSIDLSDLATESLEAAEDAGSADALGQPDEVGRYPRAESALLTLIERLATPLTDEEIGYSIIGAGPAREKLSIPQILSDSSLNPDNLTQEEARELGLPETLKDWNRRVHEQASATASIYCYEVLDRVRRSDFEALPNMTNLADRMNEARRSGVLVTVVPGNAGENLVVRVPPGANAELESARTQQTDVIEGRRRAIRRLLDRR